MAHETKTRFESLPWHDAVLLGLKVDRSQPGERDEVLIFLEWPDGDKQALRFSDCYALDAKMNFGVVGEESIFGTTCTRESADLSEIRERWMSVGVDLSTLQCFLIETNSTASILRIFAKSFSVSDWAE